jgi:hypothetical protein
MSQFYWTVPDLLYDNSGLSDFLIARGVANPVLGNRLHWYLMVKVALEDRVMAKMYGHVVYKYRNKILEVCFHLHSIFLHINSQVLSNSLRTVLLDEKQCVVKGS